MRTHFTVGELAKLNHLSKQTLIFYDKKGVFQPNIIDETNGYRYYTAEQLEVLDSILILKEMGLSLKEIKEFMNKRTVQSSITIMKEQLIKNNQKMNQLKTIAKRLERKIEDLENYCVGESHIMIYENNKTEYLATELIEEPNGVLQLDITLKRLLKRIGNDRYAHGYQIGAMVPVTNLLCGKYLQSEYAFVPLETKTKHLQYHEKPKGIYVRGYHTGPYEEIGNTYEKLLQEIKIQGYEGVGFSYEYYVLDSLTTKSKKEYVTEIQIPIKIQTLF